VLPYATGAVTGYRGEGASTNCGSPDRRGRRRRPSG
jgi:hypothetical protein